MCVERASATVDVCGARLGFLPIYGSHVPYDKTQCLERQSVDSHVSKRPLISKVGKMFWKEARN